MAHPVQPLNYVNAIHDLRFRLQQLGLHPTAIYVLDYLKTFSLNRPSEGVFKKLDKTAIAAQSSLRKAMDKVDRAAQDLLKTQEPTKHQEEMEFQLRQMSKDLASRAEKLDEPPVDITVPPEVACPLIRKKLKKPNFKLEADESIELLTTCVRYGEARAQQVRGKEIIILLGNTGAGKSTLINYLYGCEFEYKKRAELGLDSNSISPVVSVVKASSPKPEIMKIGHSKKSQTFMPEIVTGSEGLTYCDCPGFIDSRGAEIDIANTANIKNTLKQAAGIRVVILINYDSLKVGRGNNLKDFFKIVCHLFGTEENLLKYKKGILLGITNVGDMGRHGKMPLDELKKTIINLSIEENDTYQAITKELAESLFIYDPIDATHLQYEGASSRGELIGKITSLTPIEPTADLFQTVLNDSNQKALSEIVNHIKEKIQCQLREKDFQAAAYSIKRLKRLEIIGHPDVNKLLKDTDQNLTSQFEKIIQNFWSHLKSEKFEEAQELLKELEKAFKFFGKEFINVELSTLNAHLQEAILRAEIEKAKQQIAPKVEECRKYLNNGNLKQGKEILKEEIEPFFEKLIAKNELARDEKDKIEGDFGIKNLKESLIGQLQQEVDRQKSNITQLLNQFEIYCNNFNLTAAKHILSDLELYVDKLISDKSELIDIKEELNEFISLNELQKQLKTIEDSITKLLKQEKIVINQKIERFEKCCKEFSLSEAENLLINLKLHVDNLISKEKSLQFFKNQLNQYVSIEKLQKQYHEQLEIKNRVKQQEYLIDAKVKEFHKFCEDSDLNSAQRVITELESYLPSLFSKDPSLEAFADTLNKRIPLNEIKTKYFEEVNIQKNFTNAKLHISKKIEEFQNYCNILDSESAQQVLYELKTIVSFLIKEDPALKVFEEKLNRSFDLNSLKKRHDNLKDQLYELENAKQISEKSEIKTRKEKAIVFILRKTNNFRSYCSESNLDSAKEELQKLKTIVSFLIEKDPALKVFEQEFEAEFDIKNIENTFNASVRKELKKHEKEYQSFIENKHFAEAKNKLAELKFLFKKFDLLFPDNLDIGKKVLDYIDKYYNRIKNDLKKDSIEIIIKYLSSAIEYIEFLYIYDVRVFLLELIKICDEKIKNNIEIEANIYLKHKKRIISFIDERLKIDSDMYKNNGNYYCQSENYSEAFKMYSQELKILKDNNGSPLNSANSYKNMGYCYEMQGNYSKAQEMYMQELKILKDNFGDSDLKVADSYKNMKLCYEKEGLTNLAQQMDQEAMKIQQKAALLKIQQKAATENPLPKKEFCLLI